MSTNIRTFVTALALALSTFTGSTALAASADVDPIEDPTVELDSQRFDAAVSLEGQVNINTASAAELELLPGIGPAMSERIINYRKEHPFQARNNIMRIKGIGKKTFHKIKDFLIVEGETTLKIAK